MAKKLTLQSIADRYCDVQHNDDNYSIGGGLSCAKFASNRHEDARSDAGKLTLGEATQLFKKATGLDVDAVRSIIEYAVPNMEWHHAGKLPKRYGGGMKKTYFLNADEICDLAKNWCSYLEKLTLSVTAAREAAAAKKDVEQRRHNFLAVYATRFIRVLKEPAHSYYFITSTEMNGKYGWFESSGKNYNLPVYYSGWEFSNEQAYQDYLNIK